jgi:hypothetical protein
MDIIPSKSQIKELARAQAREVLGSSDVFKNMALEEQKSIYLSLIDDYTSKQMKKHGIAESMETDSGKQLG